MIFFMLELSFTMIDSCQIRCTANVVYKDGSSGKAWLMQYLDGHRSLQFSQFCMVFFIVS